MGFFVGEWFLRGRFISADVSAFGQKRTLKREKYGAQTAYMPSDASRLPECICVTCLSDLSLSRGGWLKGDGHLAEDGLVSFLARTLGSQHRVVNELRARGG